LDTTYSNVFGYLSITGGTVNVRVHPGLYTLKGTVTFQSLYSSSCNLPSTAEFSIAKPDGTQVKCGSGNLPLARQIEPLVMKANENLNAFSLVAEPLISEDNKEIILKLPSSVDPEAWKKSISTSLGLMKIIEANSKSVLNFLSYNKSAPSLSWEVLRNPSTLRLAYTDDHRKDFNNIVNLLNQSKNEIKKTMETLSEKFEEVEVPVFGKVPLGLTNAVIIYPAAVGLGCLICSYYLSQMITKRKTLQKECNVDVNKIRDLYPL
jgi:hypothetical protein